MLEAIELSTVLPATPRKLYSAWLSSKEHTAMTGGQASIELTVGGKHYEWDGYIWGENLELEPFTRIVQSWHTSEFPEGSQDSRLEVRFEPVKGGTEVTLIHSAIPEGQGESYRDGWDENYFQPMKKYFKPKKKSMPKTAKTRSKTKAAKAKKPVSARTTRRKTR